MLIYPAIDIREGKCVRLRQGRFDDTTVFSDAPVDMARRFRDAGFTRLHVVDLDGALSGIPVNAAIIRDIAAISGLSVQVGGGIRSALTIDSLLEWGVATVILGSVALERPDDVISWVAERSGARIALAADIRNGRLSANGWKEQKDIEIVDFVRQFSAAGVSRFICTDITRDGMMLGPSFSLYEQLRGQFPSLEIVASGGISSLNDLDRLRTIDVFGVVVGRALLDGTIKDDELRTWIRDHED
jgi:phosphoribosylformimino-5-aminoimidazole carboxamide ribotide isomerase